MLLQRTAIEQYQTIKIYFLLGGYCQCFFALPDGTIVVYSQVVDKMQN
jgi:hypothetical protein